MQNLPIMLLGAQAGPMAPYVFNNQKLCDVRQSCSS